MSFTNIISDRTGVSDSEFWRAISIWFYNPHVVNRRVLASKNILVVETLLQEVEIFNRIEPLQLSMKDNENINGESLVDLLELSEFSEAITDTTFLSAKHEDKCYLALNHLLPRNAEIFSPTIEFTFVNKKERSVVSLCKPIFSEKRSLGARAVYKINHDRNGITSISVREWNDESYESSVDWLRHHLYPRLVNWMRNGEHVKSTPTSLTLVSVERYAKLYESLKRKYGTEMVKIWPEQTDPKKFVYEDIAIATYLLLLWEKERLEKGTEKLQSFLDLGCGNGLLVYILSSEGHQGKGVDLRKRKIWDFFPSHTCLEIESIVPSSATKYPEADWIIGNHSDELTPWIPVISARSSPNCRYFLLPCCAYEFDGSKYQRQSASKSQYSEYIEYVKNISERCGFRTEIDRLRIPSTKRICLIGWDRYSEAGDEERTEERILEIINSRTKPAEFMRTKDKNEWSCEFTPRDPVEKVRNCTKLDRELTSRIVRMVAEQLLREGRTIELNEFPGKEWNAGRELELREMVEVIPREILTRLKNECGGLQTLLKNHGHVFKVVGGKVSFSVPGAEKNRVGKKRKGGTVKRIKVKPCWFHKNHPNGCPQPENKCNFKH